MKKKNIPALIAIILAFVVIFAALTVGVIVIGYELEIFNENETESPVTDITPFPTTEQTEQPDVTGSVQG